MTDRENLQEMALAKAQTKDEMDTLRDFFSRITDEQAAQLLALDGFTEEYKIPIWDADLGGPIRDATAEHDTPPDGYIEGRSEPRRIADDLVSLAMGAGSFDEVLTRIEPLPRLAPRNALYWSKVGEILGKPRSALPAVSGRKIRRLDYPLDKVNSEIWKLLERNTDGQIGIAVEKRASKKPITILYSINFDALGDNVSITRKLEPFDKRVYLAISALYNVGNAIISLSQIYNAMGYTHRPGASDVKKIADSIAKMAAAQININNTEEANAYKYDKFVYNASLLPMERLEGVINGKAVEAAIHLFREPPLVSFARGRKQITTIEKKLLETPVSKTDQNLQIEDYLIERISHIKTGRQDRKMLFDTIFIETRIAGHKQRQRARGKIRAILDHYINCGYIAGYLEEVDGILINL